MYNSDLIAGVLYTKIRDSIPSKDLDAVGIYVIYNNVNGKFYIGSTTHSFKLRWYAHLYQLRMGKHGNFILQRAWNKYGENAFEFRIIEVLEKDQELILYREQHYLDMLFGEYTYNLDKVAHAKTAVKKDTKIKKAVGRPETPQYIIDNILTIRAFYPKASLRWIAALPTIDIGYVTVRNIVNRYEPLSDIKPLSLSTHPNIAMLYETLKGNIAIHYLWDDIEVRFYRNV